MYLNKDRKKISNNVLRDRKIENETLTMLYETEKHKYKKSIYVLSFNIQDIKIEKKMF